MKKITFVALTALFIVACTSEPGNTILFDSVTTNKEVKLSNDEGSPICTVHLQLAYATDDNGHKAEIVNANILKQLLNMEDVTFQQAVDSFANTYTESYVRNYLPLYNQDRADTTKRSWYEYHYVITTDAHQGSQNTTVYIATIDYFEGGAHGINQQQTMNFKSDTGQLLTLDDIFVPGYESTLNNILQEALSEKVGAKNLQSLHEMGYLFSTDMFPSKNFILNDETITFIYNPYEIASYDKGSTELTLSLGNLDRILRPEYKQP